MIEPDAAETTAPGPGPKQASAVADATLARRRRRLLHNADFLKIWTAATVSFVGSQVEEVRA